MLIIINVCSVQYESLGWGGEPSLGPHGKLPKNEIWAMWGWDAAIGVEVVKPREVMMPSLQQLG
jgi:hypothetical protein